MADFLNIIGYLETGLGRQADQAIVNSIMLIITVLPLFSLPFIMKTIGGMAQTLGGFVNNRGKGIFDRTRNLGKAASSAQTGVWKRKGTEYAARNYDPKRGRFAMKNIASMAAARKPVLTRRQQVMMGSASDAYESEQIKMAKDYFSQQGLAKNKGYLNEQAKNGKNSLYTRLAAAQLLADEGGVKQLHEMYETGDDTTRKIAAKAMVSSQTMGKQGNIYATEAQEYLDNIEKIGQPGSNIHSTQEARSAAHDAMKKKVQSKVNVGYVLSQKVLFDEGSGQYENLNDLIEALDTSKATDSAAQRAAAQAAAKQQVADMLGKAQKNPSAAKDFSAGHAQMLEQLKSQGFHPNP